MSDQSALHAPPALRPRLPSALDLLALIAVVLAIALAASAGGSTPRAALAAGAALNQDARR